MNDQKAQKKLWESWFVLNSVEANGEYHDQLPTNQRWNKLFNQPIGAQEDEDVKVSSERSDRLECES